MGNRPLTLMSLISDDGRGGSDRLALEISKVLRRRGHRIIWGSPSHCLLRNEAREAGLEIYNPYPSGSRDMAGLSGLIKFCKEQSVDVVVAHHSHARHMLLLARIQGMRAKVVFTRHCIYKTVPHIGAFFQNFLVDMNIAVSTVVYKSLIRSGIWPSRAVTIYGGIDVRRFEDVPSEKVEECRSQYTRQGTFTVGMVARFQHGRTFSPEDPTLKGHEVLFRALAELGGDVNLLLLGPWIETDIEKLKLIARQVGFSTESITFCGFQENIAPFYKIMDLNVLPSPNEGLGLSIIEGMAAGVPCIGADGGGIREIITDGVDGFLFSPGGSRELARKISIIRGNRDVRDQLISRALLKVREKFTVEKTARETEEIFYRHLGWTPSLFPKDENCQGSP
jgi:glycosyltransferase involved in cell wall biosynthesis